jgi:hypothetical protein
MAGVMQYDDAHKWRNVPIDHYDLLAAKEEQPGVTDF